MKNYTWEQYFMTMAYLVAMKSKDPRTKVGAVIVGSNNEIRSTGFNGLPRLVNDDASRYQDREYKDLTLNHAEENAILNCVLSGVSVVGCTLYTPWFPCSRCAKAIIQVGIKKVVYDVNFPANHIRGDSGSRWPRRIELAQELFSEANVEIKAFDGQLIKIESMCKGMPFELKVI
jgi:dCMP deaminase